VTTLPLGNMVTIADLLAAAAKLDRLADEIEQAGKEIDGAAAAAAVANFGLRISAASTATCGQLNSCVGDTVRNMRGQAAEFRKTAATYKALADNEQTLVTLA
jgi:hypothetical protein